MKIGLTEARIQVRKACFYFSIVSLYIFFLSTCNHRHCVIPNVKCTFKKKSRCLRYVRLLSQSDVQLL